MTKKRDFTFKGKVRHNVDKRERERSFSYLLMPSDFEVYIPDPGRIDLDIIPYIVTDENHPDRDDDHGEALVGDPWYCRPFKIHRGIGPDQDTVVCLESVGQKCPVCEYRKQLAAQGDDANEQELKDLKAKDRMLYYVVPKNKDWDDDFHIFDISYHNFHNELDAELKEDAAYENFAHPEEGMTLRIRWERSKWGDQKFCKASRIDFVERVDEYTWDEVEDLPSLDDIILKSLRTYDELERLFMGADGGDDQDDFGDPDEKPERTRKRRTRSEKQDEPEEEKPVEEKKTRTRSRSRKPKDETPEEKPKTRSRSRKPKDDDNECPYGHVFGEDLDKFDDCENCSSWDDCHDANKKLK
jgi:hypothetical protein